MNAEKLILLLCGEVNIRINLYPNMDTDDIQLVYDRIPNELMSDESFTVVWNSGTYALDNTIEINGRGNPRIEDWLRNSAIKFDK